MGNRINETTTYTASININDEGENKSSSITTDDINELERFLKLAGVKPAIGNIPSNSSSCDACGEGWADDNPVNMDATGFTTGGSASEIKVEIPCDETSNAQYDYGSNEDSDGTRFSMDVHDYKGRSEHFPGGYDYRRVNHYGDNALPQNEELEIEYGRNGEVFHQLSPQTIKDMPDGFIEGLEAEFGKTVAYQMEDLAGTGSLESQNPNALMLIAQYARNVGYLSLWEDIAEYFDEIEQSLPLESVNEQIHRLQKLAGIETINEYDTDVNDIVPGQYVKIDSSVGGGYGQVVDLSPSGKYAVVEIVGEGEYDIDDEHGMPNLTGERLSYSLSDLLPLVSYDAMLDMIDKEQNSVSEGGKIDDITSLKNSKNNKNVDLMRLKELSGIQEVSYADPHGGSMISPYNDELDDSQVDIMYDNVKDEVNDILDKMYSDVLVDKETFLKYYDMEDLVPLAKEIASDAISQSSKKYGEMDEYYDYVEQSDISKYTLELMKQKIGLTEGVFGEGSGATKDNEKENKMIARLDRNKDKRSEKFKPREIEKPSKDDKYAALAKKYGIAEENEINLEKKLFKEYANFLKLDEFGKRPIDKSPEFDSIFNEFVDALSANPDKEKVAKQIASQYNGGEKLEKALLKHSVNIARSDIDQRARHQK